MLHERSATPPAAAGPAATRSPAVSVCLGTKGARLCFQGLQGRSQGKRGRDKVGRQEDVVSRASEAAPAPAEADMGGLSGACAGDAAVPAGRLVDPLESQGNRGDRERFAPRQESHCSQSTARCLIRKICS